MTAGRPITRRGYPTVGTPAAGTAGAALAVSGTIVPNGAAVEYAIATTSITPPTTGWTAAASDRFGNWTATTVYPAAGTYHVWARPKDFPRSAKPGGRFAVT